MLSVGHSITSLACNVPIFSSPLRVVRIDQKLYEAARLRGYLHCFRLVLRVQNLYEAVSTSLGFHNPFEIGLMNVGRFACKSFRLQADSPTLTSIRLHK